MRRDTINYTVVGVFVLGLFALFLVVLYQITGRSGPTDNYYVNYGNVEGIKYGTPVLYEGYQIGQVEAVEPERSGGGTRFRITLGVTRGWQIPEDSIAEVVKSGLLSAVAIDIQEGQSSKPLAAEKFITGKEATDIFSAVNDVAADIRSLSRDNIRPLLDNLNEQVTVLSADLRGLIGESVRPILDENVTQLLEKLDASASRLSRILSDENQEHIQEMLNNLSSASGNAEQLLADLQGTRQSLDTLLTDVNAVVDSNDEDLRAAVKDLQKSLYVVGQHIDAVSHHMEGSSRNMHEFTRQLRENPGVLLRGKAPEENEGEDE